MKDTQWLLVLLDAGVTYEKTVETGDEGEPENTRARRKITVDPINDEASIEYFHYGERRPFATTKVRQIRDSKVLGVGAAFTAYLVEGEEEERALNRWTKVRRWIRRYIHGPNQTNFLNH